MDSYTNVSGQCCGFCGRTACAPSGRNCGCMHQDPVPLPSYSCDQNWNNTPMPMPTPAFRSDNMSDVMPDYNFMPAPAQAPAPAPTQAPAPAAAPAPLCPNTSVGPLEQQYPTAMAYVPWQQWQTTYPLEQGLMQGTIFPELDLQFNYGRCSK
ncbi:MAG: spore coat associated protein CotJA [Enterocloster asparagiformis]|nr:spore coat associated protein CotJA [Enterocloster asparagiformis]